MANVDNEATVDPNDLYERHRVERQRLLEQRVAETLALKPSIPCPLLKGSEHGTYKLSPDEEEREIREYQKKSRQVRIMQVRAQEMLLASQRVGEFRQRKKNEKQKLLQVLKEAWQEEQKKRIADAEDDFVNSSKGIGQSHNAAREVIENMAAIAKEKGRQAEENRLWETLRYQKAKQEESVRKSEVKVDIDKVAAKDRRRAVECAAELERTRARNCASRSKSKSFEAKRNGSEGGPQKYLHLNFDSHDIRRNFIQSRLAGAPSDYKDTYFHSRFCVLKDRTNLKSAEGAHEDENDAETDAWEAAKSHLQGVELERERKAELEELWQKRKAERGQMAVAHLQKIACLEEELAMELEEEQERKHQLQLIEELSKAAHASTYKSDQRQQLNPKPSAKKKDIEEEDSAPKTGESGERNITEDIGTAHPNAAAPRGSESTPQAQPVEELGRNPDNIVGKQLMPAVDAGKSSRQSTPEVSGKDENVYEREGELVDDKSSTENTPEVNRKDEIVYEREDELVHDKSSRQSTPEVDRKDENGYEREDELVDDKDSEIIVVRLDRPKTAATSTRPSTPRKPDTQRTIVNGVAEVKVSPYSSPMTVTGTRLHGKITGYEGKTTVNEAAPRASINPESKLPGCNPTVQIGRAPSRTSKIVMSTAQASSLPNLSSKNNIRKGNKSPHRLDSPGRVVPNGHENQGTVDQIKEVRSRSRGRISLQTPEEVPEKRPVLPPIARKIECGQNEGKKMTPRRHTGTWLTNVLEKLTWWKSHKQLPFSGVSAIQDKAEFETVSSSCSSGQPPRTANKDIRKESTPKFPVKQVDSSSKSYPFNRSIPSRSKNIENASSPAQAESRSDDETGWYEACTKDVFSPEELEALQLELYGTWTDDTNCVCRNKAKHKRDKVKLGQHDNDSEVFSHGDTQRKIESLNKFKDVSGRSQNNERASDDLDCKGISKDPSVELDCEDTESIPGVKTSDKLPESTLAEVVALDETPPSCSRDPVGVVDAGSECKSDLANENYQLESAPTLPERSNPLHSDTKVSVGGTKCDVVTNEPDRGPEGLTSARDVAEKLIHAWQTGQLGGSLSPVIDNGKQKCMQKSRKRRARTDQSSHMDPCVLETGYKVGPRENINRLQQTAPPPLTRKWEMLVPERQSSVPQEINVANTTNSISKDHETSRIREASPKRDLSPSYSRMQRSRPQSRMEVFQKNNPQICTDLRLEEIVPEARSLDFILGSLSAQVKELDERLRSVTSYAIHASSADECSPSREQKHSSNLSEATSRILAGKTSRISEQSKLGLQSSDGGGEQNGCKIPVCCTKDEKLTRVRSPRAAPLKSPRICGHKASSGNGDHALSLVGKDSPLNLKPQTASTLFSGSRPKSIRRGQSPESSMATCLENLADLMQQINGSTICERMAPQTLCKSLFENLPKCAETGANNARNEFASCDKKDKVCTKVSVQQLLSHGGPKSFKEPSGVRSRASLRSIAELSSVNAEPAVLHANAIVDAKEPRHGIEHCRSGVDPLRSMQQPERLSLSSIDLQEAMSLDDIEEQLLLSGSVDFSPWNTEKLPDLFSSVANLERSSNHTMGCDTTCWDGRDVDCEGTLRPVYCHVKKESEWLLRGNKFKRKSKAYEKRRAGRAKGKQKRAPKKSFNPVALPPRHSTPRKHYSSPRRPSIAGVLPKVSTTRIQPSSPLPGVLKLEKKELKMARDGSTKLNLTTRSLPAQFPLSVTAEEVQKWLSRDAIGCADALPDGPLSRESIASIRHQARFAGNKKPEMLESVASQQGKLPAKAIGRIPELGSKEATCRNRLIQPTVESRRRPASAGTILKC